MIPLLLAAVLGAVVVAVLERTTRATFAGELFAVRTPAGQS